MTNSDLWHLLRLRGSTVHDDHPVHLTGAELRKLLALALVHAFRGTRLPSTGVIQSVLDGVQV